MENYGKEILSALLLLFKVGIVITFYSVSKQEAIKSERPNWKVYLYRLIVVCFFSFLIAYNLGSHIESPDEPLFGQGEVVEDYEPTFDEKAQKFVFVFTVLIIPTITGAYDGLKERWLNRNKN